MENIFEIKNLNEVCDFIMGQAPNSSTYNNDKKGTLFIRVGDFGNLYPLSNTYTTNPLVLGKSGDIFLCIVGATCGKINLGIDGCITRSIAALRPKSNIIQKYIYYFLKTLYNQMNGSSAGSAQGILNKTILSSIEVPIPFPNDPGKSLEIQQKIVNKLDLFFEHYEKLKEEKQKAVGNYDNILAATISKLVHFGNDELPKNWQKIEINNLFELNPKKTEVKNILDKTEISFIPMKAVNEYLGEIIEYEVREIGEVRKGYTYFKEGDILFAKITPCMENGKYAIAKNLKNGIGFGTTEFHVFRSKSENILNEYLYYFLRQNSFRKIAKANMCGAVGQARVPTDFLNKFEIPFPYPNNLEKSLEIQKQIVEEIQKAKGIQDKINEEKDYIQKQLEDLPKSVLAKVFRGELI